MSRNRLFPQETKQIIIIWRHSGSQTWQISLPALFVHNRFGHYGFYEFLRGLHQISAATLGREIKDPDDYVRYVQRTKKYSYPIYVESWTTEKAWRKKFSNVECRFIDFIGKSISHIRISPQRRNRIMTNIQTWNCDGFASCLLGAFIISLMHRFFWIVGRQS